MIWLCIAIYLYAGFLLALASKNADRNWYYTEFSMKVLTIIVVIFFWPLAPLTWLME